MNSENGSQVNPDAKGDEVLQVSSLEAIKLIDSSKTEVTIDYPTVSVSICVGCTTGFIGIGFKHSITEVHRCPGDHPLTVTLENGLVALTKPHCTFDEVDRKDLNVWSFPDFVIREKNNETTQVDGRSQTGTRRLVDMINISSRRVFRLESRSDFKDIETIRKRLFRFKCSRCHSEHKSLDRFLQHLVEGPCLFNCPICSLISRNPKSLEDHHKKVHQRKKPSDVHSSIANQRYSWQDIHKKLESSAASTEIGEIDGDEVMEDVSGREEYVKSSKAEICMEKCVIKESIQMMEEVVKEESQQICDEYLKLEEVVFTEQGIFFDEVKQELCVEEESIEDVTKVKKEFSVKDECTVEASETELCMAEWLKEGSTCIKEEYLEDKQPMITKQGGTLTEDVEVSKDVIRADDTKAPGTAHKYFIQNKLHDDGIKYQYLYRVDENTEKLIGIKKITNTEHSLATSEEGEKEGVVENVNNDEVISTSEEEEETDEKWNGKRSKKISKKRKFSSTDLGHQKQRKREESTSEMEEDANDDISISWALRASRISKVREVSYQDELDGDVILISEASDSGTAEPSNPVKEGPGFSDTASARLNHSDSDEGCSSTTGPSNLGSEWEFLDTAGPSYSASEIPRQEESDPWQLSEKYFKFIGFKTWKTGPTAQDSRNSIMYECQNCIPPKIIIGQRTSRFNVKEHMKAKHLNLYNEFCQGLIEGRKSICENSEENNKKHYLQHCNTQNKYIDREHDPWQISTKYFIFMGYKYLYDYNSIFYKCQHCEPPKIILGQRKSRSNLKEHVRSKHSNIFEEFCRYLEEGKKCKQLSIQLCNEEAKIIGRETLTEAVLNVLVENMLAFSICDTESFRHLLSLIPLEENSPDISKQEMTKHIEERAKKQLKKLKQLLSKQEYLSTTVDGWTCKNRGYIGQMVHWIEEETLERKSAVLSCRRIIGPHSYDVVARTIEDVHMDYGITDKIVCTTTDNGTNFFKVFKIFGYDANAKLEESESNQDEDAVPVNVAEILKGEAEGYLYDLQNHHRCLAHLFILIASSDALAVYKNKQNIEYRRAYNSAFSKAKGIFSKQSRSTQSSDIIKNEVGKLPVLPNTMCWDSFFNAIQKILDLIANNKSGLEKAMSALQIPDFTSNDIAFMKEWHMTMIPIAAALDTIRVAKESLYMGALLPVIAITNRSLLDLNDKNLNPCSVLVKALIKSMKDRFGPMCLDENLQMASCLNPQFKLGNWLESLPSDISAREIRRKAKSKIISLLANKIKPTTTTSESDESKKNTKKTLFSSLYKKTSSDVMTKQITMFVDGEPEESVLNHNQFPCKELETLFIKYNTGIPSLAYCEQVFSLGKEVLRPKHSSLSDRHFEMLVLLIGNLKNKKSKI